MTVTLQDVAKAAGVSVSTASRVLSNSKHPLNEETRERILQIARELGYKPNLLARGLRKDQSYLVGVVVDNIDSIFAPPIIRGAQDVLKPAGYTCLILNADWNRSQEEDAVRELTSRSADGIVFVDTWLHPANLPTEKVSVPHLFVNRIFSSGKSIGPDDRYGAILAVQHLVQLGHERIAFINGPDGWQSTQDRKLGYESALRAAGLPVVEEYIETGDWDVPSGSIAARRLLDLPTRPTAIFAANDVMALGAIYAIQEQGLRVPQDIAIVGYDDQDFASFCNPTLTSISLPAYEMGRKAGELLLEQMSGFPAPTQPELVRGSLIIRESCGDSRGRNVVRTTLRASHSARVVPFAHAIKKGNLMSASLSPSLHPVALKDVQLTDTFWSPRQEKNRSVTLWDIYEKLQKIGYLDALKLEWQPGMPNEPHIFWESDLAKWLEAASYALAAHPDAKLNEAVDHVIRLLEHAQQPDGYLNAYFTVVEPEKRWTNLRDWHELYCAGHLIEAGVAHHQATGQRTLLDIVCRYANYIDSVFGPEPGKRRGYCGHQEIELALIRLYRETGLAQYLNLARFFVEERGQQPHYYDLEARERGEDPKDFWAGTYEYNQSHAPIREQEDAVGHSVRAMYLYCAASDLVRETGDEALLTALERMYQSVIRRQMYITGGIGSGRHNEGFTRDYDLPNDTAYAETCAAIGMFLWMHRMLHIRLDGRFSDIMERVAYNGMISGLSLDGTHYFYENPLAVDRENEQFRGKPHHRQAWYGTACCPPNIARLLASLNGYLYSVSDSDTYVHLYVQSQAQMIIGGQTVTLAQETNYPWDGDIQFVIDIDRPAVFGLNLRIPGWARSWHASVGGEEVSATPVNGYLRIERRWASGDSVTLKLDMPVERVYAHPQVAANRGRVALQRGPLVFCLEGVDNGDQLDLVVLPRSSELSATFERDLLGGVVTISGTALRFDEANQPEMYLSQPPSPREFLFRAIPYCLWDNRKSGDLLVWIREY
ncbi:MAG: glycoside hydrolase family 127 protein [Chloroflexi bacterium]|nr:glycoside hydrolase family 127 protein [Chloroflexota bacterium]